MGTLQSMNIWQFPAFEPGNRKKPVGFDRLCSVHYGLDALHIGLPGTVGASVGMADLDAESHVLIAELTLCHVLKHLLACVSLIGQLLYDSRTADKMQENFLPLCKKVVTGRGRRGFTPGCV